MANTVCAFQIAALPVSKVGADVTTCAGGAAVSVGDRALVAGAPGPVDNWRGLGHFPWLVLGKVVGVADDMFTFRVGAIYQSLEVSAVDRGAVEAILKSAKSAGAPSVVRGLASVNAPTQISRAKEDKVHLRSVRANAWEREHGPSVRRARIRWRLGESPGSKK